MAEVWAVIPAGGRGHRFSETKDKLLVELAGLPVLIHTLQAFLNTASISGIMVVVSEQNLSRYQSLVQQYLPAAKVHWTLGGETRRDSVYQGLCALPEPVGWVAIHDAARPLIRPSLIEQAIQAVLGGSIGAVVAIPIVDTVKQTSASTTVIQQTLDRNTLWRAQTPQVFQKEALLKAHHLISDDIPVTDDAQLLELAGIGPMELISGDDTNLKITGPQDIWLAEAFLAHTQNHP